MRTAGIVVANRYTTSNAVHQASKLPGRRAAGHFCDWLFDLEYGRMGLPAPDLVLYLDLPTEVVGEDAPAAGGRRPPPHADIHEQDGAYLRRCREGAREIARDLGWIGDRLRRRGRRPGQWRTSAGRCSRRVEPLLN